MLITSRHEQSIANSKSGQTEENRLVLLYPILTALRSLDERGLLIRLGVLSARTRKALRGLALP